VPPLIQLTLETLLLAALINLNSFPQWVSRGAASALE
jgi:hypothetical protein